MSNHPGMYHWTGSGYGGQRPQFTHRPANVYQRPPSPAPPQSPAAGNKQPSPKSHGDFCSPRTQNINEVLRRLFLKKGIDLHGSTKLGAGRYSKVVTAKRIVENDPHGGYTKIAIKIINTERVKEDFATKFLPREIDCWQQLNHPHLVRILGHYEALPYVFLTMEFGEGGDLLRRVQKGGPVGEPQAREWLLQIVHGVGYMHELGMAHRDLKLENIILFADGTVKVADFGFSRKCVPSSLSNTFCGSKSYSAPEILLGLPYSPFKADVWSIGVIGFVMLTDSMPFRENCPNASIVEAQRKRDYHYPSKVGLSHSCVFSIDEMLTFEPAGRPLLAQCLRLPFFTNDGVHRERLKDAMIRLRGKLRHRLVRLSP